MSNKIKSNKIKYPNYKYEYDLKTNNKKDIDTEKLCRICYDNSINSELICPCKCNGSIKWIHEFCLIKWIETSKKDICPQCKYKYKKTIKYKYPKLKFFSKYIKLITFCLILITISLLSLLSINYKKNNDLFLCNTKIFSNLYHIYNGLKLFLILSVVILTTLHIKKIINILNIINSNNLYIGSNIIEFSYCIFLIYNELIKNIIKKNSNIKYLNFK